MKIVGALRAVEIGSYLQEALRTGRKLYFDETEHRVEQGSL
jgi:myo-inositol 2-dehydrogenase/D-chiro-inositol 1-dehydrogenase